FIRSTATTVPNRLVTAAIETSANPTSLTGQRGSQCALSRAVEQNEAVRPEAQADRFTGSRTHRGRYARLDRTILGRNGNDLRGAQIPGAEHGAAKGRGVVEGHMLRPHAERERRAGSAFLELRDGDCRPSEIDPPVSGSRLSIEGKEVHRRRTDE